MHRGLRAWAIADTVSHVRRVTVIQAPIMVIIKETELASGRRVSYAERRRTEARSRHGLIAGIRPRSYSNPDRGLLPLQRPVTCRQSPCQLTVSAAGPIVHRKPAQERHFETARWNLGNPVVRLRPLSPSAKWGLDLSRQAICAPKDWAMSGLSSYAGRTQTSSTDKNLTI